MVVLIIDCIGLNQYLNFRLEKKSFNKVSFLHCHVRNFTVRRFFMFIPFHTTGLFPYLLETPKNLWFSDVFRGYRERPVA